MEIRRPVAALMTALALIGGGATLTGCVAAGQSSSNGVTEQIDPNRLKEIHDNLPDLSDADPGNPEDLNDRPIDPG